MQNHYYLCYPLLAFLLHISGSCCAYGCDVDDDDNDMCVVATNTGCIKGTLISTSSKSVSAFFGIPFAEPPIGENRFKRPIPVKSWSGIHDATVKPPPCMQYSKRSFPWIPEETPNEDCLYLNVWVPELCQNFERLLSKFSVLVWIYGGGYYYGSSTLDIADGSTLATNGKVIVVSMNYRLGAFGFLQVGTEDAPGNMGMYDQNLAMKWVKENIEFFGGDPDSITLFGNSAGAVSVGLHIISPLSRNLFKRAIMESGSPYDPTMTIPLQSSLLKANDFAVALGCANETVNLTSALDNVMSCLQSVDATILCKTDSVDFEKSPFSFMPNDGNDFLPKPPIAIVDSANFESVDVLIGNTKDEGSFVLLYSTPEFFSEKFAAHINITQGRMLIMSIFQNSTNPTPDTVADFYLSNVNPNDSAEIIKAVYDSITDSGFVCPSVLFAEKMKNRVFYYLYTHRASNSMFGDWMGVTHTEEIPFVFGYPLRHPADYTRQERSFSNSIIQKWATFARYGKPIRGKTKEYWPKFTKSSPRYLELNPRSRRIGVNLRKEECDFWRRYYSPTQ